MKRNGRTLCELRMLLNSIVTTGVNGTESIQITSVTDSTGMAQRLGTPLDLYITKATVYIRYTLEYAGDVNSKPIETVGSTSMLSCTSGPSSLYTNSACGSLMLNGNRVVNSEGFCCPCSLDQMIGLGSHQRGEVQCNPFSALVGTGASVHCLRWGQMWYSLFHILTPTIESVVTVSSNEGPILSVSAQRPVASATVNNTVNITARLVGSFGWQRSPTDWGLSVYAAAPNIPGSASSADIRYTDWRPANPFRFGMLIPTSEVDLSGKACNKIGVSHAAFVNDQANRCSGYIGDCLSNQIDDKWTSSKASDLIPSRLCQSIGGVFVENDGYRLSCGLADSASDVPTQVLIEMNAVDVQIVVNASEGLIVNVTTTQALEALVQATSVFVIVHNTGDLHSEFIVSVSGCEPPTLTLPLSGTRLSIPAATEESVVIKIEDSDVNAANYTCVASLGDPDGNVLDSKSFTLEISSVSFDKGVQDGTGSSADSTSGVSVGVDQCESSCSGFFDLTCFISHLCWSKLGTLFGTVGGIGIGLGVMTKFGLWSILWKGAKKCASRCCSGPSRGSPQDFERHQPQAWPMQPVSSLSYPAYYPTYATHFYQNNN